MSGQDKPEGKFGPHDVRSKAWIGCAPFENNLGMEIVDATNGEATLRMPFVRELCQGFGLMHGGALVSLADTAVVMAIKSILPSGSRFATTRIEVDYVKPVISGIVTARAGVASRHDRDLFGECTVVNDAGIEVLRCKCRFRIGKDVPIGGLIHLPPPSGVDL
jgi:acyl-CoA thioesterase